MGKGSTDTEQKKGFSLVVLVGVSFVFLIIGFAGGTFTGPTVKEVLGLSNPKDDLQASADAGLEPQNSEAGDASLFMPMAGVFSPEKDSGHRHE